jgi:hypothetical protein
MKRIFLLSLLVVVNFSLGFGQSAVVTSRPAYIDLSAATSESAVLMTLSSYSSNDARYRLYNGSNQYNCWDAVTQQYITGSGYGSGPQVPGTPMTTTTFWILSQRGNNISATASYRDRLGPGYGSNYQTVALPAATSITTPFTLSGNFIGTSIYSITSTKYVVLAYSGATLISAASTALTTGAFAVICPTSSTIDKVEIRTNLNVLITSVTGSWNSTTSLGNFPTPTIQAYDIAFSNIASTSMTVSWTKGDGIKRIALINTSNSFTNPVNGTDPTANPAYSGSGEQVIYNGNSNTVNVTGLTGSTTYWFRVYEYNGTGTTTMYLTSTATNNPNSQQSGSLSTAPVIINPTSSALTNNSALLGGEITSDGGSSITERGTVWKTSTGVTITDNPLAEGGMTTGVFSHTRNSLPSGSKIFYAAYAINSVGTTLTAESNFFTLSDEPTSHVTGFTATTGTTTSIDLSWATTASGATGYMILQRIGASAPTGTPSDATQYSVGNTLGDGTIASIVTPGSALSQTISGLIPATQYSFTIIPFASDGSNYQTNNFYTAPTIPSATASTVTPAATTYTWGGGNGSWTVSTNWTPTRSVPVNNDILQFNSGTTVTVNNIPNETIGKLLVSGNTTLNLTGSAGAGRVITISGGSGADLDIEAGSALNINSSGVNTVYIDVATTATGSISGSMSFTNGNHRLTATDASAVTFNSGSVFTQGSGFNGNAFGASGNVNVIVFASGSTFVFQGGSNPFGLTAPNSRVVFQTGSLYKQESTSTPAFQGRIYADFEMNVSGSVSVSGSTATSVDNLTVTLGTLNFNMTGTPGHAIKGNISVASGQTLNFNPASTGTVNLGGTLGQTISGPGTISGNASSTLNINNASGVTLDNNMNLAGNLSISTGTLTVNAGKQLTASGTVTLSNAECLVLKSDATNGNASFIDGTLSGTGTMKSELYLPEQLWHYISMPVAAATANVFLLDYLRPSDPTDATGWGAYIVDPSTALEVMRGYACWPETGNPNPKVFSGTPNTGAQSITLSRTSTDPYAGWHLVGNPYPSSLDLANAGISWGQFEPTAWFWNPVAGNYETYPTISGYTLHSQYAPPMQGFFTHIVDTYEGSTTFSLPNAARSHSTTPYLKNSSPDNVLELDVTSSGSSLSDKMAVLFSSNSTAGYDPGYDAWKLTGLTEAPQIASMMDQPYSFNALPYTGKNMTIPVRFTCGNGGNFSIHAVNLESFSTESTIILEDLKEGTTQNLKENPDYTFNYFTSDNPGRFLLHFTLPSLGTGDPGIKSPVSIYSYSNSIYVKNADAASGTVLVYDMLGRMVSQNNLSKGSLNKYSLLVPEGYYIVKVITDAGITTEKIYLK